MIPYVLGNCQRDDAGVRFWRVYVAHRAHVFMFTIRCEQNERGGQSWVVYWNGVCYVLCCSMKRAVEMCLWWVEVLPLPVSRSSRVTAP